ncbi:RanGTP-binding protein [Sporothrix schenckii 1099-18]|nr:RanGTP-binding protein [Sporothrix schenckii 1099-18]KJR82904.1 RanGTP-binding protein [Sporothrix schenckii 1099-18]
MDELLDRLGVQAVNYAMRCGIALTSTFAMKQCSRLLRTVDNKPQHMEFEALQKELDSKIKIVSPALDLIEFKSGRGNVFLGSAAALAKALHRDIVALGNRVAKAAATEEHVQEQSYFLSQNTEERNVELLAIIRDIKNLLVHIDSDVPLLQLAITASGESLSASLPPSISPSRLLQASMCLVIGDTQFSGDPCRAMQIGPSFTLSLYMLFLGHSTVRNFPNTARNEATDDDPPRDDQKKSPYGIGPGERKPIWQEVLHKARVRICRTPPGVGFHHKLGFVPAANETAQDVLNTGNAICGKASQAGETGEEDEYSYFLEIIEDLDDGRAHDDNRTGATYDGVPMAGEKEAISIRQISKLFYTDSGRILNIGNQNNFENSSVLLLKRDLTASTPSNAMANIQPDKESGDEGKPDNEDEQRDVDRQIREESKREAGKLAAHADNHQNHGRQMFPSYLDPEWLALEVFVEDENDQRETNTDDSDVDDEHDDESGSDNSNHEDNAVLTPPTSRKRKSVDTHLAQQLHNMSVSRTAEVVHQQSTDGEGTYRNNNVPALETAPPRVPQSPYGSVTSSLSLLEMLIRLASLQQFQQTSHLAIPDHILTFFLEETSATGLRGEARLQAKQAAEQRMGFDPFTDSPTKT